MNCLSQNRTFVIAFGSLATLPPMMKDAKKKYHVKGGDGITLEFQQYFPQLACPEIKWNKKNKKVLK